MNQMNRMNEAVKRIWPIAICRNANGMFVSLLLVLSIPATGCINDTESVAVADGTNPNDSATENNAFENVTTENTVPDGHTIERVPQDAATRDLQTVTFSIQIDYPGATTFEVEEAIASRLSERLVRDLSVRGVLSYSEPNSCRLLAVADSPRDANRIRSEIASSIDQAILPSLAEDPQLSPATHGRMPFAWLSIELEDELLVGEADRIAVELYRKTQRLVGVAETQIIGVPQSLTLIKVDESKLAAYSLHASDLYRSLEQLVLMSGQEGSATEVIPDLVISSENGVEVRWADVATVEYVSDNESVVYSNGVPSIALAIYDLADAERFDLKTSLQTLIAEWTANSDTPLPYQLRFDFDHDGLSHETDPGGIVYWISPRDAASNDLLAQDDLWMSIEGELRELAFVEDCLAVLGPADDTVDRLSFRILVRNSDVNADDVTANQLIEHLESIPVDLLVETTNERRRRLMVCSDAEFFLIGGDRETLTSWADAVAERLPEWAPFARYKFEGNTEQSTVRMEFDLARMQDLGLTVEGLGRHMNLGGDDSFFSPWGLVRLKLGSADQTLHSTLARTRIALSGGTEISLSDIATFETVSEPLQLVRWNNRPAVRLSIHGWADNDNALDRQKLADWIIGIRDEMELGNELTLLDANGNGR